VTHRKKTLHNN